MPNRVTAPPAPDMALAMPRRASEAVWLDAVPSRSRRRLWPLRDGRLGRPRATSAWRSRCASHGPPAHRQIGSRGLVAVASASAAVRSAVARRSAAKSLAASCGGPGLVEADRLAVACPCGAARGETLGRPGSPAPLPPAVIQCPSAVQGVDGGLDLRDGSKGLVLAALTESIISAIAAMYGATLAVHSCSTSGRSIATTRTPHA